MTKPKIQNTNKLWPVLLLLLALFTVVGVNAAHGGFDELYRVSAKEVINIIGPRGPTGAAGKDGVNGTSGTIGKDGVAGVAGANGAAGAQGVPGSNDCISGICVSRQATTPGTQETGNINIDGSVLASQIGVNVTPTNTLSVGGTANFGGHTATGAGAAVNGITSGSDVISGVSAHNTIGAVYETLTTMDSATTMYEALGGVLKLNPGSAPLYSQVAGNNGGVEITAGNAQNFAGNVTGMNGSFIHAGTGTATSAVGLQGVLLNLSTGTITTGYGLRSIGINLNTGGSSGTITNYIGIDSSFAINMGTITNFKGIQIQTPQNAGTITNNYGLYIQDQSSVGSSLSYNLYSAGSSSKNYLAGEIQSRRGQTGVRGVSFYDDNFAIGMSSTDLVLTTITGSSNGISFNDDGVSDASPLMRIRGDGNVGIGKSSPTDKLQVDGTIRAGKVFFRNIDNNDAYSYIMYDGADNMKYAAYDAHTFFTESGSGLTQRMIIDGNGNVGIGADTSPDALLEVGGTSILGGDINLGASTYTQRIITIGESGTNSTNLILRTTDNSSNKEGAWFQMGGHNGFGPAFDFYYGSSADAEAAKTHFKIVQQASGGDQTRIYLDDSGNLGIGDTSPDARLDVSNTSTAGAVLQLTNSAGTCDHTPTAGAETVSCSSDARLKTNITDAASVLSEINGLKIHDYTVIASGQQTTGLIAQEVINTHPEMVHMGEDGYYKVDSYNPWKVLKGIQELSTNVDDLNTSFAAALQKSQGDIGAANELLSSQGLKISKLSDTLEEYATRLDRHDSRLNSQDAKIQQLEAEIEQLKQQASSGSQGTQLPANP